MDVPFNLLSVLKCCICEGYLSCGPIYIVENDKATCGRCNNAITNTNISVSGNHGVLKTRNLQYENLASVFLFPCQFALFGCPEKIVFSEGQPHPHELSCAYKSYVCPILPNNQCDWRGPWHHLLEHCEENHPDNILENPHSSELNFGKDSIETYVIPCFNTLFILRISMSHVAARVIYSIYLLDDPSKIPLYAFSIDCKRNSLTMFKHGKIGTVENFIEKKPAICIISRHVLLMQLGGVAGTTFTISLKQISKKIQCKFCFAEIEYFEGCEWICNNCESILHYCQNQSMSCTFKDINIKKIKKHERYFCKYINKCFHCSGIISAGGINQHFNSSAHENTISSKIGVPWKATETPKRTLNYVLLNSRVIDKLFCNYYLDARQLSLVLYTTHSSDQLCLYKCAIEVIDKTTNFHQTLFPDFDQDFFWDWRIDIDFDFIRYETVEIDIKISFEKSN